MGEVQKGHVEAGGVRYGYEIHGAGGAGPPLVVLHGGFGTLDMFGPVLPRLTAGRQVIGVDLYGHGRTALTDRPIDPVAIGDDLAVVVRALGFEAVDVFGYSFGGMVGLRLAAQHTEVVRRLVLASVPWSDSGFYPALRAQQHGITRESAAMFMQSPAYAAYKAVAPRLDDYPEFVARMGDLLRTSYEWSEDLAGLKPTTLLVYGDSDCFTPEHIVRSYQLLGGFQRDGSWDHSGMSRHRLAILPGVTHYDLSDQPGLYDAALAFLEAGEGA